MTTNGTPRYFDGRLLSAADLTSEAAAVPALGLRTGDPDAPLVLGSVPNPA